VPVAAVLGELVVLVAAKFEPLAVLEISQRAPGCLAGEVPLINGDTQLGRALLELDGRDVDQLVTDGDVASLKNACFRAH
jgi:hypothetical protein